MSYNDEYRVAVQAAAKDLTGMTTPTEAWEHAATVTITRHLTPLFRRIIKEANKKKGGGK